MKLSSPAFKEGASIPVRYTCDGEDVSPPLTFGDVPKNAKSLVLIMDDPDAPVGIWDHWVAFDIPPATTQIAEGSEPAGTAGKNSWKRTGYGGPCPPDREHRYFFRLYALDAALNLPAGSTKGDVERAMRGHVIAEAALMGRYNRKR